MTGQPRVTIWNEFRHERRGGDAARAYPGGIHRHLAEALEAGGMTVRTAVLDEPEHGLGAEILSATDVLVWWGHEAHDEVANAVVERIHDRVLAGMGMIALHSSHYSKIFRRLMGTSCGLTWRVAGERERLWVVAPGHPIARGLPDHVMIEPEEMYGEPFDIPEPDELVFLSWFQGGEVFRSGCCFRRGRGRIFYFRPGHETFPAYHHPLIRRILVNAVHWAAPAQPTEPPAAGRREPREPLG